MNSTALAASPLPAPMTRIDGNARAAWERPESAGARRGRRYSVRIRQALLGAHPCAQLLRFALVGGASNLSYLLLFLACTGLGAMTANAAGSIVSAMIANELHRRITFRAAGRISWLTAQWQGGGLALIGLLTSTAALAGIEFVAPALDELTRAGLVLAVMAAVGGFRFLALRGLF
ncbi:GtrA family protein [Nocardia cyriacigeorgica]|uniref:GtrA family protein n=1 Tax=Nocardia cyriacigeorgica TaxID=135487 RepID=UPI001894FCB4|nr:GtrA family protein [Nocardia cyriacigeorgica]MBF6412403.1 GtrA family protein [Nocardia cyriacigeorgica]